MKWLHLRSRNGYQIGLGLRSDHPTWTLQAHPLM